MELKMSLEGLEKERDFYFGKLRDIEVMCQDCDNGDPPPIVQKILEVLYATEVCERISINLQLKLLCSQEIDFKILNFFTV